MDNILFYNNKAYKFKNNSLNEDTTSEIKSSYDEWIKNDPDEFIKWADSVGIKLSKDDLKSYIDGDVDQANDTDKKSIDASSLEISAETLKQQEDISKSIITADSEAKKASEEIGIDDIPGINGDKK